MRSSWQEETARALAQKPSEMKAWLTRIKKERGVVRAERRRRMEAAKASLLALLESKLVNGNTDRQFQIERGGETATMAIFVAKESPFCFFVDVDDRGRLIFRPKRSMQELASLAKKAGFADDLVDSLLVDFDETDDVEVEAFLRALTSSAL